MGVNVGAGVWVGVTVAVGVMVEVGVLVGGLAVITAPQPSTPWMSKMEQSSAKIRLK